MLPHRAQFKLTKLAATDGYRAHRQGSALPVAGGKGHSGSRSAVGNGRAHEVLRSAGTDDRQPALKSARRACTAEWNRMLGRPPAKSTDVLLIRDDSQRHTAPGLPSAVQSTPCCRCGHTCYWMAPTRVMGAAGLSAGLAAGFPVPGIVAGDDPSRACRAIIRHG